MSPLRRGGSASAQPAVWSKTPGVPMSSTLQLGETGWQDVVAQLRGMEDKWDRRLKELGARRSNALTNPQTSSASSSSLIFPCVAKSQYPMVARSFALPPPAQPLASAVPRPVQVPRSISMNFVPQLASAVPRPVQVPRSISMNFVPQRPVRALSFAGQPQNRDSPGLTQGAIMHASRSFSVPRRQNRHSLPSMAGNSFPPVGAGLIVAQPILAVAKTAAAAVAAATAKASGGAAASSSPHPLTSFKSPMGPPRRSLSFGVTPISLPWGSVKAPARGPPSQIAPPGASRSLSMVLPASQLMESTPPPRGVPTFLSFNTFNVAPTAPPAKIGNSISVPSYPPPVGPSFISTPVDEVRNLWNSTRLAPPPPPVSAPANFQRSLSRAAGVPSLPMPAPLAQVLQWGGQAHPRGLMQQPSFAYAHPGFGSPARPGPVTHGWPPPPQNLKGHLPTLPPTPNMAGSSSGLGPGLTIHEAMALPGQQGDERIQEMNRALNMMDHVADTGGQKDASWWDTVDYWRAVTGEALRSAGVQQQHIRNLGMV